MFLVLRGCDSYELVRSIVYNVCKVCDCTGSGRHGAKVYVFIIYDWIKLILLVLRYKFLIVKSIFCHLQSCYSKWFTVCLDRMYNVFQIEYCICYTLFWHVWKMCVKLWNFCFHENFYFKSHLSLFCWELLIYSITKFLLKLQTFIHVYAMLTLAYWGKSCSLLVQSSLSI